MNSVYKNARKNDKEMQKATYILTEQQIIDIGVLSAKRRMRKGELMREIVNEYLKEQGDLDR